MVTPIIVFWAVQAWALTVIIRQFRRTYTSIQQITKVYRDEGVTWNYWKDSRLKIRTVFNPSAIVSAEDSSSLSAAKKDYIAARRDGRKALRKALLIEIAGFVVLVIVALIESFFRRPR